LVALIQSFSKSPNAMHSGFHHTGVLCNFWGLHSGVAENSIVMWCCISG